MRCLKCDRTTCKVAEAREAMRLFAESTPDDITGTDPAWAPYDRAIYDAERDCDVNAVDWRAECLKARLAPETIAIWLESIATAVEWGTFHTLAEDIRAGKWQEESGRMRFLTFARSLPDPGTTVFASSVPSGEDGTDY